jgi:hypothetical protein
MLRTPISKSLKTQTLHALDIVDCILGILIRLANPHQIHRTKAVDAFHKSDLLISFFDVALVNTDSVNPDCAGLVWQSQISKSKFKVGRDFEPCTLYLQS